MEAITNTLGLNWQGLLWHIANFAVLLILLQRFLFKPVVGMLDARERPSVLGADHGRAGVCGVDVQPGPGRATGPRDLRYGVD